MCEQIILSSRGIQFVVWCSHATDLVVVTYFLNTCSVPPGLWYSLEAGLVLYMFEKVLRGFPHYF
jgi:hypothetical protein